MDYGVQIRRAAKGNRAAMTRLAEAGKGEAWLLCRLLTENDTEAARVCREGYTRLWETLKAESDPGKNTVALWTTVSAVRACQKAALARDNGVFREARVKPVPAGEDWEAVPVDDKAVQALLTAVKGLTLRRRFIWLLAKTQGLNPHQIAGVLKLREERVADSLSAAEGDIRQALTTLKEQGKTAPAPGQAAALLALAAEEPLPETLEAGIREDIVKASPPVWKTHPSAFWTSCAAAAVLAVLLPIIIVTAVQSAASADAGTEDDGTGDTASTFDYSAALEDSGFFTGVTALDCVELCDYDGIVIPVDTYTVTTEEVNAQVVTYLSWYAEDTEITNRAVVDGDTLNIDYVGTVDGAEFDGSNTDGAGTTVTIGETSYVDDFLEQLIGHMPGETFTIEVTFPEDYGDEALNGKDAQFEVTINSITESKNPALTDAFVAENFSADYGWSTIGEMRQGIEEDLRNTAVSAYLKQYVLDNTVVNTLPEVMVQYQQDSLSAYYDEYAAYYSMETEEFVTYYMGYESLAALLESYKDEHTEVATEALIDQAIAEAAGLSVTDEDLAAYFTENFGDADYSSYEEYYGIGYLRFSVLPDIIADYLAEHAVYAEA